MKAEKINAEIIELRRKEKYLEAINAFTTELFEAQTVEEIVWAVTHNAISKLGFVDCVIYLFDKEKDRLIQRAAFGPKNPVKHEIFKPIEIKPGQGIVGAVFRSGVGEIITDTSKDPRYIEDDERRFSEMAIPMFYKDQSIGVIDSEHPEKNFFTKEDFTIITTISQLVSTKVAQAWATEELVRYQENLKHIIQEKTSELKEKNKLLTAQNKEKEILIKEIHHRVKNNMQIMASLANLQMHSSEDPNVRESLKQFSSRINSMAIIHEKLYQNSEMSGITIDFYLVDLLKNIIHSFDHNQNIQLTLDLDPIPIGIDDAIPLGLLLNELTTNSLKHAFKHQSEPEICITVKQNEGFALLHYSDNGSGIQENDTESDTFGMELISVLSDQIGYDVELESKDGFNFIMKINI